MNSPAIDCNKPFAIYATAEVIYDGRASSKLKIGNYLIIHKNDGSLIIHGCNKVTPINYQSPGAKLSFVNNIIIVNRKRETITITLHKILQYFEFDEWSNNLAIMQKTEKELVNKLANNIHKYFNHSFAEVYTEFITQHGKIDFLGIDEDGIYHVVEVKRIKATLTHCTQLGKYLDALSQDGIKAVGYIAAPNIGDNAIEYLKKRGNYYIKIEFD